MCASWCTVAGLLGPWFAGGGMCISVDHGPALGDMLSSRKQTGAPHPRKGFTVETCGHCAQFVDCVHFVEDGVHLSVSPECRL